jgi:hypothetical protein
MVSRRSGQDETTLCPAVEGRLDGGHACSGGERRNLGGVGADWGVGIQPTAALRRKLAYSRDIARIVDPRQKIVGCGVEWNLGTTGEKIQAFKCRIDRQEPARVFRVIAGVMLTERK